MHEADPPPLRRSCTSRPPQVLDQSVWQLAEQRHHEQVDRLVAGHAERARAGRPHPVHDFLFTYYSLRPARLRRWHPGAGTGLAGPASHERLAWRDHHQVVAPGGSVRMVTLDTAAWLERRGPAVRQIRSLLAATAGRRARLGCFGLHEWAMVYRQPAGQVRHAAWPLRLGADGTDAVVEGHQLRCTHHDAFRFFTVEARPRNAVQPERADQVTLEQPGCVHVSMDLYKWAYKLLPAVPSDLLLACFELARDARELDMRASPYDLTALGYAPIPVETAAGKAAYVEGQRALSERAEPLRAALIDRCDAVMLSAVGSERPGSDPKAPLAQIS